jgi:hypothetical protein
MRLSVLRFTSIAIGLWADLWTSPDGLTGWLILSRGAAARPSQPRADQVGLEPPSRFDHIDRGLDANRIARELKRANLQPGSALHMQVETTTSSIAEPKQRGEDLLDRLRS